jgi:uncharacterized membrane protein YfcA
MSEDLLFYIAVGFLAQIVDGAIGMAYGLISTSMLLSAGIPPATASACVHAAETFTTAASGASHWRLGNVDFRLVRRLAIPGAIGGAIGAYILSSVDGNTIKPYVSAYIAVMGIYIIWRAIKSLPLERDPPKHVAPLGFFGGMIDAIGGGGWGPIVTSTLIGRGTDPRFDIGSVNLTEFFVTLVISATFMLTIGLDLWPIIVGLIIGGIFAAPLAALTTRYLPTRPLMFAVGFVIAGLSIHTIVSMLT